MPTANPSLSHRHLLALGTFLVPLAVLAWFGWSELERGGQLNEQSLRREASQFVASAQQAVDRQFELQLPPAFAASQRLLIEHGPIRTAIRLRDEDGFAAVKHIILLDDQAALVRPRLPAFGVSLPLIRDPQRGAENAMGAALAAAEAQLTRGDWQAAMTRLELLIKTIDDASPEGRRRLFELVETEVHARFRLASALRATGKTERAREQFEEVKKLARNSSRTYRMDADMPAFQLVATAALADMDTREARLEVLTDIANNRYDSVADGLATALANRLAVTFSASDPYRETVDRLLREESQRVATREFAARYDLVLKDALRKLHHPDDPGLTQTPRIISSQGEQSFVLAVRPATEDEMNEWGCTQIGINFGLDLMLEPALQAFVKADGNFTLALDDPDDRTLLAPPANTGNFEPQTVDTKDKLKLSAYPADPERLTREAKAAKTKQTLLLIAVFAAALGGALWSWRSVSREAELATLKLDLVSRVSHELKTPLALIRMYGETLGMGRARDTTQASEFGSIIARESERLTTLIQRILDFSRQQAGTLEYSAQEHDLGELVRTIAYAYAPHLAAKGVFLVDDLPLDIHVVCDKNGLESAIVNLLENTTKYGKEGVDEQEVDLVLRRVGNEAVIEVSDRGRGIPADERSRVFDGFYRASNAGEVRGAGLGLGIVRHFALAHDGDIESLPREGGGTIMRLTLPLATASAAIGAATTRPPQTLRTEGNAS